MGGERSAEASQVMHIVRGDGVEDGLRKERQQRPYKMSYRSQGGCSPSLPRRPESNRASAVQEYLQKGCINCDVNLVTRLQMRLRKSVTEAIRLGSHRQWAHSNL